MSREPSILRFQPDHRAGSRRHAVSETALPAPEAPTSVRLAEQAICMFGEDWAQALSRFTGVGLRTCQRIKAAAGASEEHSAAPGVAKRLVECVARVGVALNGAEGAVLDDNYEKWVRAFVLAGVADPDREVWGPYDASAVRGLLWHLDDSETALFDLVQASAAMSAFEGPTPKERDEFHAALRQALSLMGALMFRDAISGRLEWMNTPSRVGSLGPVEVAAPRAYVWADLPVGTKRAAAVRRLAFLNGDAASPIKDWRLYDDGYGETCWWWSLPKVGRGGLAVFGRLDSEDCIAAGMDYLRSRGLDPERSPSDLWRERTLTVGGQVVPWQPPRSNVEGQDEE